MSKVVVILNQSGPLNFQTGRDDSSGILLKPGTNEIEKSELDYIKKHPVGKLKFETKVHVKEKEAYLPIIEVVAESSEDGNAEEVAFAALGAEKAKDLVKNTYDTTLLKEWSESETRKTVAKAIDAQLKKIDEEREGSEE